MTTQVFLTTLGLFFGTIVIVFAMKHVANVLSARARQSHEDYLRALAQKAVAAQSENQAALTAIRDELARVGSSLAAVEKILRQVE